MNLQLSTEHILEVLGVPVTRLVADSRHVEPGDTFLAYVGEYTDGRLYIEQAIRRGANAVLWESEHFVWDDAWNVPNVGVLGLRQQAGEIADRVYGKPSESLWMVGVTGTNGKTSTSHWVSHALDYAGRKCGLIGTLGNGFLHQLQPSANTTPEAVRVHGLLQQFIQHEAHAAAMEVSSHALDQGRVNGVRFDVALLTNLTRDHLDYHGDMESYANSKRKLFYWPALKFAVVNLDDAFGAEIAEQLRDADVEVVGYGLRDSSLKQAERLGIRMVYASLESVSAQGLHLEVHSSWGGATLKAGVLGRFNASNLLGVLSVLLVSDIELTLATESLAHVQPVAGRMQRLGGHGKPTVIVDYAHTPDALEKVLLTLREAAQNSGGSLSCVFGCGGDRDRGKRSMMGHVAEKLADFSVVTSDNPRSEQPQDIIDEIVSGMNLGKHEVMLDRTYAITRAIQLAQPEDIVLVAGKGHESYQEINGIKHPFSDAAVVEEALQHWRKTT